MSPLFESAQGVLWFDDGGSGGLPLVFLHSLAGSSAQWDGQLGYLRPARRCIALDLRGHGRSGTPRDADYTLEAMAHDVAVVVDSLGVDRLGLVGHSLGGGVAISYVGARPQRVAGLLLVDPVGDQRQVPADQLAAFMEALESHGRDAFLEGYWNQILAGARPDVRQRVLSDLRQAPPETVNGVFRSLAAFDPLAALARYDGPILSVITPLNDAPYSLHKLIPSIPVRQMTGTGHWLQMDKPEEFNEIVEDFFASQ